MRSCHMSKDEGEPGMNRVDLREECSRTGGLTSKGLGVSGC